jgi:hypothetical protein
VKTGTCRLCGRANQQLCDSHYLPKKVYAINRAPELKSPHPRSHSRLADYRWSEIPSHRAPRVRRTLPKFLMGEIPLPSDVVVTIDLWHARKVLQASHPPQPAHLPDCQKYWFYIPGLVFSIYIGEAIPVDIRRRSALRNVVCVDVPEITSIWELTKSLIRSQAVGPKAKLLLDEIAAIRAKAAPKT